MNILLTLIFISQVGFAQEHDHSKMAPPSMNHLTKPEEVEHHKRAIRNGESMADMPMLSPKRIYTVTGQEDFDAIRGYGREDGMVGMMNLMMVEGSNMEGMEMEPLHSHGSISEIDPLAPENVAKFAKNTHEMTFHHETATDSYALSIKAEIQPNPPIVGENKILFSVAATGTGQRISGAKLTSHVEMASMDMGSEEPKIKELANGKYEIIVRFTMGGPWKVKIEGTAKSGEKISSELLFDAGAKEPWVQSK